MQQLTLKPFVASFPSRLTQLSAIHQIHPVCTRGQFFHLLLNPIGCQYRSYVQDVRKGGSVEPNNTDKPVDVAICPGRICSHDKLYPSNTSDAHKFYNPLSCPDINIIASAKALWKLMIGPTTGILCFQGAYPTRL